MKEAPQLVILPIENDSSFDYSLVWKLELLSERPHKNYVYFVDAINGKIVKEYSNIMEAELYGYITGNYYPVRVNDPTVNSAYSTTNIKMYNIYGQLVATLNTDANGYYYKSGIAYTYYYLQVPLENSWIKMKNDADGGNPIRATISTLPGQRNYDWSAGDGTNVRWHASRIHDFFKSAPLNYSGMDYQMEGRINALDQYGNPRNGAADGTNIYFGTQNGQYWARSSDVVYHEYTHNTIYHVYGGWIGSPSEYYIEASAMDEGLSDYFACTINNDPIQGEDVGVNRNLDNNTFRWTDYMGAHWNGQVIGGACWDLRQAVGQSVTDNLVFKALQITPRARNFVDYLKNILLADNSIYSGNNRNQILAAFSAHGITVPTLSVTISGPSEVYPPTQKGQPQTVVTWYANVSGGVSPFSYTWNNNFNGNAYFTSNGATYTGYFGWPGYGASGSTNFIMSVNVTDAIGQTASATKNITVWYEMFLKKNLSFTNLPAEYSMSSNYPNPFNPSTNISYQLPVDGIVKIAVFNVLGQEVASIINEFKPAGYYSVIFDASNLPSGIYFARIFVTSNERKPFEQTIKMLLTK